MDPIIGGALIGGAGSLLGGLFASKAARDTNAVSREQIALTEAAKGQDFLQSMAMLYGPARAREMFRARYGEEAYTKQFGTKGTGAIAPEVQTRIRQLEEEAAGLQGSTGARGGATRTSGASRNSSTQNAKRIAEIQSEIANLKGQKDNVVGRTNESDFDKLYGDSLVDQYKGLLPGAQQQGRDLLSQFDGDSGKAMSMLEGLKGEADAYGQRRINQVDVDAGRQLTGLNRLALSRGASAGVGSGSLLNQAMRGNTQSVMESAQRAKDTLEDQRLGVKLGLGQQGVGMAQQNAGTRLGIQGANIDRESQLQRLPMDVQLNTLGLSSANPGQSFNASPLANVSSPAGVFGQAIGGFASNLGGQLFGQASSQALIAQMLAQGGQNQQQPQSVRPTAQSTWPMSERQGR